MAILKNDRNELLYASSSRITGATVLVTSGTVGSLVVPKNATTTVPDAITLTATASGYISPSYVWKYKFSNDVGYTTLAGTTSTITVTADAAYLTSAGSSTFVEYQVLVSETTANIGVNQTTGSKVIPIIREGSDGLNNISLRIFKRTTTNVAPTVDTSSNSTYTFSNGTLVGQPTGWTLAAPSAASGAYLWSMQVTAAAITASYVFANTLWSLPTLFSQDGTPGATTAKIFAYKRASSLPTDNPGAVTYDFTTNTITTTPLANSWLPNIPSGSLPLYITVASASSTTSTDNILATEWSTPVLFVSNGTDGINTATVFLYARNSSISTAPTLTTTGSATYTFATGALTGTIPSGWSQALPDATSGTVIWAVQATAASTSATDTINNTEWGTPRILAQKGDSGAGGTRGSRTVYLSNAVYTSTYTYNSNSAGANSYAAKATDTIATITSGTIPTTPITGDTVTFSNGTNYVYTITYNAAVPAWEPPGTVIDGNLLVTGSVTSSKIDTRGLTIRDENGNAILTAGSSLATSTLALPGTITGSIGSANFNDDYLILNSDGTDIDVELRFARTTGGPASVTWNGSLLQASKPFISQELGINNISATAPTTPFAKQIWLDTSV